MITSADQQRSRSCDNFALLGGGAAFLIGCLGLLGWLLKMPVLTSLYPCYIPIASSTCVAFVVQGTILILHILCPSHSRRWPFMVLAATTVAFGILALAGYPAGSKVSFQNGIFYSEEHVGSFPINLMSPLTGLLFSLSGISLLLLLRYRTKKLATYLISGLAGLVAVIGLVGTISYMYGAPLLYKSTTIPMALTTTISFLFLGSGLAAAAGPTGFLLRPLTGNCVRATLLRTFVPLGFTTVICSGILHHYILTASNSVFVVALSAVFFGMGTVAVIFKASRKIGNTIERAEAEICRLNRLYNVLSQVNRAVIHTQSKEELLPEVCRLLVECGAIDLAWIGWLDPSTSQVIPLAGFGKNSEILTDAAFFADDRLEGQGTPGRAIRNGKPFVCNDCGPGLCSYPPEQAPVRFGFRSCGSFPLRFQGKICGVLSLCIAEPSFFRERETGLLEEVASDISFAFDKIEDNSQRKRLSEQFQNQSAFLQTLMDAMPYPVFYKDPDLRYLGCNTAFEKFIGIGRNRVIGRTAHDIYPKDLADSYQKTDRELQSCGESLMNEEMFENSRGVRCNVLIHKALFSYPGGEEKGIIGAMVDITKLKSAEQALRTSEERFSLAMQGANDGLWDWNLGTDQVYYSPRWKSMLGYGEEELENHLETWKRLVHPDDLEPTLATVSNLLEGRIEKFDVEFRMKHRDGHYLNILSRAFLLSDVKGRPMRLVGTHVDLTERRQVEDALKESEERFALFMSHLPCCAFIKDDQRRLVYINERFEENFGIKSSEWLGKTFDDLWPCEIAESSRKEDESVLAEGRVLEIIQPFPQRGELHTYLTRKFPISRPGKPLLLGGVAIDITERKLSEDALRESERRLREMLENAQLIAMMLDKEGNITFCNDYLLGLTGWKREEVLGQSWFEKFIPKEEEEEIRAIYETCASSGDIPVHYENDIVTRSGKRRNIAWNNTAMRDKDGSFIGVTSIGEDITERIEIEKKLRQAQKMEAIGTLAGGIAHDFNNILGVIFGYAEMARMEINEENPVRAYLQGILKAAYRAKGLVEQILAFSRRSELEKKPVQVGLIVKEALKMLRASLPSTIEIKSDVASQAVVMADPTQIHQVLMNLCTNAAQAMQEEGGMLEVELVDIHLGYKFAQSHSGLKPGPFVRLTVSDTGHGIDPAIRDRIFDPFFTTKEPGVGTGLGLAVVHGIVKNHGGAVEVESSPEKGATVQVFFPAAESSRVREKTETVSSPRGRERILLVDDEPDLIVITKQMLERLGYEVCYRTNGAEALETFRLHLAEKRPFDLVITDMTMPRMTGVDLAGELLQLMPGLPIILCTGFSEKVNAERAKCLGIEGFLAKPVAMGDLAHAIREVLDGRTQLVKKRYALS